MVISYKFLDPSGFHRGDHEVTIAGLNFFVETIILKKEVLPFTQGLISFFLSLFGLISLKMVSGIDFSWLSLLLAALLIGLVDLIIPATLK